MTEARRVADPENAGTALDNIVSPLSVARQGVWFGTFTDPDAFGREWMQRFSAEDETLRAATLRLRAGAAGAMSIVAEWTAPDGDPTGSDWGEILTEAANAAVLKSAGVARRLPGEGRARVVAAYPVLLDGMATAIIAAGFEDDAPEDCLARLRWSAGWIRAWNLERARDGDAPSVARARATLELIGGALEEEGFETSARRAATETARLAECDRVSIGFRKGRRMRIVAISNTAHFGRRMDIVRQTEAAMDEAVSQQAVILHPSPEGALPHVAREHEKLLRQTTGREIVTIPFMARGKFAGAFTFERMNGATVDQPTIDLLDAAAGLIGPILEDRRRADRWLVVKAWDGLKRGFVQVFGAGHLKLKLAMLLAVLLGIFFSQATTLYRVASDADIEGSVQRVLAAPFDGYISEAGARAGDDVTGGEVLARLDDRELSLERVNWVSQRRQRELEYEKAIGDRDRARQNVLRAEVEQADAQIAFLDGQIERARLLAPFDGIVVSGDLSQAIGGAVTRGEPLFRVAPLNDYRVVIWVDEARVDDVAEGDSGHLVLGALPSEVFDVSISGITPVAEVREGRNMFRVEAEIASETDRLRPGMSGIAKIDVEEQLLIEVWTRSLRDWLQIQRWRWLG